MRASSIVADEFAVDDEKKNERDEFDAKRRRAMLDAQEAVRQQIQMKDQEETEAKAKRDNPSSSSAPASSSSSSYTWPAGPLPIVPFSLTSDYPSVESVLNRWSSFVDSYISRIVDLWYDHVDREESKCDADRTSVGQPSIDQFVNVILQECQTWVHHTLEQRWCHAALEQAMMASGEDQMRHIVTNKEEQGRYDVMIIRNARGR